TIAPPYYLSIAYLSSQLHLFRKLTHLSAQKSLTATGYVDLETFTTIVSNLELSHGHPKPHSSLRIAQGSASAKTPSLADSILWPPMRFDKVRLWQQLNYRQIDLAAILE